MHLLCELLSFSLGCTLVPLYIFLIREKKKKRNQAGKENIEHLLLLGYFLPPPYFSDTMPLDFEGGRKPIKLFSKKL